jgi:hypothetical protein
VTQQSPVFNIMTFQPIVEGQCWLTFAHGWGFEPHISVHIPCCSPHHLGCSIPIQSLRLSEVCVHSWSVIRPPNNRPICQRTLSPQVIHLGLCYRADSGA